MMTAALAVSFGAMADSPYLPVVGPAPLRFSTPPIQKPLAVRLPPLPTILPQAANSELPPVAENPPSSQAPTPVETSPPALGQLTAEPVVPVPGQYAPVVSNGVEVVRTDVQYENLTPQMFMRFFTGRPGTNGPGLSVISPMPFVPPAPSPPSSTATFQTTPPVKP